MNKNIRQIVGQRIRNYRTQRKLTQEKLAELVGCHFSYIGQVERGEKNATIESIKKIAAALDIPMSKLFQFSDDEQANEDDYAYLSYELIAAQDKKEQQSLYTILCSIKEYKNL